MKHEKEVQKTANELLMKLNRRTSTSAYKAFANDELNRKYGNLRLKLDIRYRLGKYIHQTHITEVSKLDEAVEKACTDLDWDVPSHMHAHSLKLHLADGGRLGNMNM